MIALEKLLTLLPVSRLEELAIEYQVDAKNQVRLPGSSVFICLLNGLLHHGELTQRLLEETYFEYTGQHADHSSFGKRLEKIKPAYFAALFAELYAQMAPKATKGESQSLRLRFVDATTVTLSAKLLHFGLLVGTRAKDKTHRHVKSVLELSADGLPNLLRLCRDKAENADSVALGVPMEQHTQAGDLWIFDKGCHGRERLRALHQKNAFFLTPHTKQGLRVDKELHATDPTLLPTLPPKEEEATFVLVRVEQAVFQNSQPTKKWEAMSLIVVHGLRFDERSQTWKPLTLMTNLPLSEEGQHAGSFPFLELAELYRRRWQIECFFKFIKQHLGYSHLTSRNENGIQVMIYMSLIAALLLIWYKKQSGIDRGWRSVKFWFAHDVREWTMETIRYAMRTLANKHAYVHRK